MEPSCLQDLDEIRHALARREELLMKKDVLRQSELYNSLGKTLGGVVLDNMTLISKELMGATDPLKGPSDNLWIPPGNRINNKICLVPQSPIDITKAFTHQGILEIGREIEATIDKMYQQKIRKATAEASEFERFEYERRLRVALKCEENKHLQNIRNLREECQVSLAIQMDALHTEYIIGRNEYVGKYRCDCEEICITTETQETQTDEDFTPKSNEDIHSEYLKKLEQMDKVAKCLWKDFKEHLRIQRHVMTCSKITELLHVVCAQKLDAKHKIEKIKKEFNNELNKITGENGYKRIKDKYISLLKNLKLFTQLTQKGLPEHDEYLKQFENAIDRDILDIEFEQKLCKCCLNEKNFIKNKLPDPKTKSPAGIIIFSQKSGTEAFCTCEASSDDNIAQEFKNRLATCKMPPKECIGADWSTTTEEIESSESSNKYDMDTTENIPITSDLMLAQKIAALIDIDDILQKAFSKIGLNNVDYVAIKVLQEKLFEYVSNEFNDRFNKDSIMVAIGNITAERRQSYILAARDSLELIKASRSSKNGVPLNELNQLTLTAEENPSTVESPPTETAPKIDLNLASLNESLKSAGQKQSCLQNHMSYVQLDDRSPEDIITGHQFWESRVNIPKYMIPPDCRVEPEWIYRKTTDEEWNELLGKLEKSNTEKLEGEESSSSCSGFSIESVKVDPLILKKATRAVRNRMQETNPIGQVRIRSVIDLLERNEDISKMLYQRRRPRRHSHSKKNRC